MARNRLHDLPAEEHLNQEEEEDTDDDGSGSGSGSEHKEDVPNPQQQQPDTEKSDSDSDTEKSDSDTDKADSDTDKADSDSDTEKADSGSSSPSGFTLQNHVATSPDIIQDSVKRKKPILKGPPSPNPVLKGPPSSPKPVLKGPPSPKPVLKGTPASLKPILKRPPTSTSEGKKDSRAKKSKVDNGDKEKSTIQAKTLPSQRSSLKRNTKENGENGKDEQPKKVVEEDEREFSKLYPYLCKSMKNRYAHMDMVSKDWVEILEESLCDLEISELDELERRWKEQILSERQTTLARNSVLVVQIGMVKKLHSRRG